MKKLLTAGVTVLLIFTLTACGGVKNATIEGTAKTFVKALIDGNEKTLGELNKSDSFDYPTQYLISNIAPDFAGKNINDLKFTVDKTNGFVTVKGKGINQKMEFKKIGEKYYFITYKQPDK